MICFLDMDGVLVNFVEGTYRAFGKNYDYARLSHQWNYFEEWGLTFPEFDAVCTTDFWAGLRWMHDGKEILQLVEEKFGLENIYLFSCPMPNVQSATGKMMWIERHLPQYKKRTIISQISKELFANGVSCLIDDKSENIEKFAAAGGKHSLIARPWNYRHDCKTIPTLKKDLEAI